MAVTGQARRGPVSVRLPASPLRDLVCLLIRQEGLTLSRGGEGTVRIVEAGQLAEPAANAPTLPALVLVRPDQVAARYHPHAICLGLPLDPAEFLVRLRLLTAAPWGEPVVQATSTHFPGLNLTPTEHAILDCLVAAGHRGISCEALIGLAFSRPTDPSSRALLRSHVRNLRRKISGHPEGLPEIITLGGLGYMCRFQP